MTIDFDIIPTELQVFVAGRCGEERVMMPK